MKAGPKAAVDETPLPWRPRSTGSARFAAFCDKFVKVPKGTGAPPPGRNPRCTLLGGVCEGQPSRNPESQYLGTGAFRIPRLMIAVNDHFLPKIHDEILGLSTTGSRHFQDATSQNFVGVVIAMFAVWKVRVAHCERHVWSLP